MEQRLGYIEKKVDKILTILSGDKEFDSSDVGLIGEMADIRKRIERLEKWKDRVIYFLIGASFFAGWTIPDLLSKFFTK